MGLDSDWENKLYNPHQMSSLKAQYNISSAIMPQILSWPARNIYD